MAITILASAQITFADAPDWWQRLAESAGLRPRAADEKSPTEIFDSGGKTTALMTRLGLRYRTWDGLERASLLIIGPDALTGSEPMPGDIEKFAAAGGKVLILAQDPIWIAEFVGLEPSPEPCLRAGPGGLNQAVAQGLPPEALGGWPSPLAKSPIRAPNRGGWRSLLDPIGQPGFTILMEMDYGWGRITWCSIDFDMATGHEPAMALARRVIEHAARPSGLDAPSWRADREANRRLFDPAPTAKATPAAAPNQKSSDPSRSDGGTTPIGFYITPGTAP